MSTAPLPLAPEREGFFSTRLLDVLLGLWALSFLAVFLPLLGPLILLDSKGGLFFRQARLGRMGRTFEVTKLRTMVSNAPDLFNRDGSRYVGKSDARITRMGRFLRLGIDELPQVLNVIRGEMSFIGPRPDDVHAIDKYIGIEWLKLAARPGLSGLAQVTGRNDLPWKERIKYDVYYQYHRNWWLDMRIVGRTLAMLAKLDIKRPLVSEADLNAFLANPQIARDAASLQARILAERPA